MAVVRDPTVSQADRLIRQTRETFDSQKRRLRSVVSSTKKAAYLIVGAKGGVIRA